MDLAIYFQVNADSSDDIDYKYRVKITRWIYVPVGFQVKTDGCDVIGRRFYRLVFSASLKVANGARQNLERRKRIYNLSYIMLMLIFP